MALRSTTAVPIYTAERRGWRGAAASDNVQLPVDPLVHADSSAAAGVPERVGRLAGSLVWSGVPPSVEARTENSGAELWTPFKSSHKPR